MKMEVIKVMDKEEVNSLSSPHLYPLDSQVEL